MNQFTPEQVITAQTVLNAVPQATQTEKLALLEAGLVESGMRNLNYGDRDSQGVFQERPSQGWTNVTNIHDATIEMFNAMNKSLTDPGAMAQSGERSAYPGRYDQMRPEAEALLAMVQGGGNEPIGQFNQNMGSAGNTAGSTPGFDLLGGVESWVGGWAARVGLVVFGALLVIIGLFLAFKDTGAVKSAAQVGKAAGKVGLL